MQQTDGQTDGRTDGKRHIEVGAPPKKSIQTYLSLATYEEQPIFFDRVSKNKPDLALSLACNVSVNDTCTELFLMGAV